MPLNQHVLAHTNGRLGFTFANQEIEVVEVKELDGDVTVEPELEAEVCCDCEDS